MKKNSIPHPQIDTVRTGKKFRNLRKQKNVSVKQLQNLLQCESVQAIYNWEKGATLPKVDNLLALSIFYGIPMEELLEYDIIENEAEDEIPYHVKMLLYEEKNNLFIPKKRGLTI